MRDLLARRGPDGAGLWRERNVLLAHRRLSVMDPTEAGAQPMFFGLEGEEQRARFTLVYNGELYNDGELRRELGARGVRFRTRCDTETVLAALAVWGLEALRRLRGMYALALYDTRLETLTLARDPLGIKPLYYHVNGREVIFASEAWVVARHPDVGARPDRFMVSGYLSSIRTVLGERTMYEGVRAVRAGEAVLCELGGDRPVVRVVKTHAWGSGTDAALREALGGAFGAPTLRAIVEDSVERHMRSDVPACALLSGGVDSTIVAALAGASHPGLMTYCAGAPLPSACSDGETTSDLLFARRVAAELGTRHGEAHVTRELFSERWPWMVRELGVPLSTPNEVAIWCVASRLRRDGCVVTLSGEGADELFAGYEGPLRAAVACEAAVGRGEEVSAGLVELNEAAWVPPSAWSAVLNGAEAGDERAAWLSSWYEREFEESGADLGVPYSVETHLRFHQRVNLAGLLQRLDTATMLAGVEGRTPFADLEVARAAMLIPSERKFRVGAAALRGGGGGGAGEDVVEPEVGTKLILREAFADVLPGYVSGRAKASFPLPFRSWVRDHAGTLRDSAFAREVFTPAAIGLVSERPEQLWRFAWPMMNLAMWGDGLSSAGGWTPDPLETP